MKYLVFVLAYFLMVDVCWGQCNMANWWYSFDKKGWSLCDSTMEYMTGMERNTNRGDNDKIYLLEKAKCCQAPSPNRESQSTCLIADWWVKLNRWVLSNLETATIFVTKSSHFQAGYIYYNIYLADFLKTNLTKFAVICLSEKASKGMFLTAREAPKSRNSEDKEKRRREKSNGQELHS